MFVVSFVIGSIGSRWYVCRCEFVSSSILLCLFVLVGSFSIPECARTVVYTYTQLGEMSVVMCKRLWADCDIACGVLLVGLLLVFWCGFVCVVL